MGALTTVDHKIVGRRYILTAFFFLILAGLSAVAMRIQLARPESGLIGPISTTSSSRCMARR